MVTTMKCEQTQYLQGKAYTKIATFFNVKKVQSQSATSWKQSATSWKYLTFRPPTNAGKYRPKKMCNLLISLISLIGLHFALRASAPSLK